MRIERTLKTHANEHSLRRLLVCAGAACAVGVAPARDHHAYEEVAVRDEGSSNGDAHSRANDGAYRMT